MKGGKSIIIIDGIGLKGEKATVCHEQNNVNDYEIAVQIEFDWGILLDQDSLPVGELKILQRDLVFWDYPDEDDDWNCSFNNLSQLKSMPNSRNWLLDGLNSLKPVEQKTVRGCLLKVKQ